MTSPPPSLPSMEIVVRDLLRLWLHPEDDGQVGRDILGTPPEPWYVRVQKVPGGSSDRIQADTVLDIEVFMPQYLAADSLARHIEALLLGYPHVVEVDGDTVVIDSVTGGNPAEIPWEDPAVSRILGTYVITARR